MQLFFKHLLCFIDYSFLYSFLILMVFFSPSHKHICPPSQELYTPGGLLAWEGVVVALSRKREEGRESGSGRSRVCER